MRISLRVRTNNEVPYINSLRFCKPNGTTLTVDRDRTEYRFIKDLSNDGIMFLDFINCYLWAIDDHCIFEDASGHGYYLDSRNAIDEFIRWSSTAKVELELEDDAPVGYKCSLLDVEAIS